MANYHAYYWFNPTSGHSRSICEPLGAESLDDASRLVQERLTTPSFVFDSPKEGRVIIISAHVQYVEIEEEGCGDDVRVLPEGMHKSEDIVHMLNQQM